MGLEEWFSFFLDYNSSDLDKYSHNTDYSFIISTINMAFLFVKAMTSGGPNGASEVALSYMYGQKDAGLYGYSMSIGVVIFIFSFALSALVNKVTEREPLEF